MPEVLALTALLYCLAQAVALLASSGRGERGSDPEKTVVAIDALLPQTQCGECGYAGCLPYARAIAEQGAALNLCPPGGPATVRKLEKLLGRTSPRSDDPPIPDKAIALIDEETCIGCVKCIAACPVDAIIGSAGQLHSVIPEYCTGCRLCLAPCPVDCISMVVQRA